MFVINTEKLPIKVWGDPADAPRFENALVQARNLANHPLAHRYVCLMPDYHVGYGMPIGGVFVTKDGVVPNAVGVDIGCGMVAARTTIRAEALTKDLLQQWRLETHKRVPVGQNHHQEPVTNSFLDADPDNDGWDEVRATDPVIKEQLEAARYQLGTLGSGNHFIELQADTEGLLWLMLHSGSRNLGKRVCDYYDHVARELCSMFKSPLPDRELAFLPRGIPRFTQYLNAMQFCMRFAELSRVRMYEEALYALHALLGETINVTLKVDTHHNFAAFEHHFGEDVIVHRKGAVKAEGLVTIPGSMGTASYICEGLRPRESFNTCSHGAGRVMGRKQANTQLSHEAVVASMAHVVYGVRHGEYDEAPQAYKDVDVVIAQQTDLVSPRFRLTPLAVVKG